MRLAFIDVRPDERNASLGAFFTLLGMMAAHAMLETARDALFLANFPANRLPLAYLAIALVSIPISTIPWSPKLIPDRRNRLSMWLIFSGAVTAAFWILAQRGGSWAFYALYVWSGVFSTISVLQFWVLMAGAFTVTQAKRLFAIIGVGSILGAILGSLLAQNISTHLDARAILLVASGLLFGAAMGPYLLQLHAPQTDSPLPRRKQPWYVAVRRVVRQPYAKRLALLTLLSAITLTFADFIFKSMVQNHVMGSGAEQIHSAAAADRLSWLFATAYLVFNCLSLLAQITIVGWMTRNLGVDRVLAFLPLLLLASSFWIVVGGGVLAAMFLKGFDGTFRYSLNRTAYEVLYVPLSNELRESIKTVVDIVGQRGGQAVASLFIWFSTQVPLQLPGLAGQLEVQLAFIVGALCVAWIGVAIGIKHHYFDLFRKTLHQDVTRTQIEFPQLDLASLEALIAALSNKDEREVVAALELLSEQGRIRLVPALILYHPSPRVVIRALELFDKGGRTDHLHILDHLLVHPDGSVRQAALLHDPPGEERYTLLERFLSDESPDVRATAIVGLLSSEKPPHPRVESILDTLVRAGSSEAKQALARAIRHSGSSKFDGILTLLANSRDPRICREVALAMAAFPKPAFIPALLPMLQWRESREEARQALVAIGPQSLDALTPALQDPKTLLRVRRHLPRTISRFDPQYAANILLAHLPIEQDSVVIYKILRAVGRLRTNHPSIRLDMDVVDRVIEENLRVAFQALECRVALGHLAGSNARFRTQGFALLHELLLAEHQDAIERIFRLMQMKYPREDFSRMYRGMRSEKPSARASARELLQHTVKPPERDAVLGLLEEVPDETKLEYGARFRLLETPQSTGDAKGLLRILIDRGSTTVRAISEHYASEIGLSQPVPAVG
jgi:AAA family ATP:ADP antiporter